MLWLLAVKWKLHKVIMVSGVEDEEIIKESDALGVKGYVHKPLILEELEKIVLAQISS